MTENTGTAVAHEAYAFCCMRCGHGWEQAYDIEHHVDSAGHNFVVYKAGGVRVPSPLSSPSCTNCGGHVVRIMRSGQVSSVRALAMQHYAADRTTKSRRTGGRAARAVEADAAAQAVAGQAGEDGAEPDGSAPGGATAARPAHHWHLSDLLHLHPFHHRK